MNEQLKQRIKQCIDRRLIEFPQKEISEENKYQAHLYVAAILSGMQTQLKDGYSGSYIFASNGKQVVALPSNAYKLTNEMILINIKNLCVANGLDFNKYYNAYLENKNPSTLLEGLQEEIVEKLGNLVTLNELESADQLLKGSSNSYGVLICREGFNEYFNNLESKLRERGDLKGTTWRESSAPIYLVKDLMQIAKEIQEEQSIKGLAEEKELEKN